MKLIRVNGFSAFRKSPRIEACAGLGLLPASESRGFVFWEDKVVLSSDKTSHTAGFGIFHEEDFRDGGLMQLGFHLR